MVQADAVGVDRHAVTVLRVTELAAVPILVDVQVDVGVELLVDEVEAQHSPSQARIVELLLEPLAGGRTNLQPVFVHEPERLCDRPTHHGLR